MLNLSFLEERQWLIEPNRFQRLLAQVLSIPVCPSARGLVLERQRRLEDAVSPRALRGVKGKVGIIPIYGPLEQRLSAEGFKAGSTSTEDVSMSLDRLVADASVDAIVLHMDSPGGVSYGIEELGDKIYAARDKKKIYAIADSQMCSAAYWLGSAAGQVCCTPGGDVGSIGVYTAHIDQSKALESQGVKISLISAGEHKTLGNPFEPLPPEARSWLQEQVDYTYSKFLNTLKRNRSVTLSHVREKFGQGKVMNADQALVAGMIDRIMTFGELLARLTGNSLQQVKDVHMDVLRLRQAQRLRSLDLERQLGPYLTHDSRTMDDEPPWGDVDKTKLPRVAFAEQGEPDKKSTWSYPHHFVRNGMLDIETGVYKSGTLYLHKGGLNAAWAAASGARSGQEASSEVIAHLQRHRESLGLEN